MKNLALLCNLHADGPATLAVLRRDGCEGLTALLEYEVRDLARLLDWDDPRAERFLREGSELSERLHGLFEPEREEEDLEEDEAAEEPCEADGEEPAASDTRRRVLDAWRGLDEAQPPAPPAAFVLPRPERPARGATPLRALGLTGVAPELLRGLAELGVATVEQLEERAPLALARSLGTGVTRLLRLRFLVRRATRGEESRGAAAPRP